ncbi:protein-(glutamine-N5) methyltransferase, release factor-specific [Candidatus Campbellbacteria bacterium]|nr:MAG: protein-(glutamine-N5) methyltransferase, release factor-specific [Candidatus Campbellbacteria bacterium]
MNLEKRQEKWLLDEKYKSRKCEAFSADLEKLKKGYPLDFLIGNRPFLNCKIDLSYKPLIPRDETEFLVSEIIKNINQKENEKLDVLDIFSGSGCIGVSILKNCPKTKVHFSEINQNYLKQIQINLKENIKDFENKSEVICSDIFENINKKYNLIIANPPYIPQNQKEKVQKSVLNFEDPNALFAKNKGLYFIEKLIDQGFKYLKENGKMYIEFDQQQKDDIQKMLQENKNYSEFKFLKDQFDKYRFVEIKK